MTVSVAIAPGAHHGAITRQEIMRVLKEHRVACGPLDQQRIESLIRGLRRGDVPMNDVVIVKGIPPVHGQDGRIVDLVAPPRLSNDDEERADYYQVNRLRIVNKDTPVLEIIPPTPHRPGTNVLGREVPARIGTTARVILGHNVALSDDRRFVYATRGGRFEFSHGVASVEPDVTVGANISFRTGNVDFEGDVVIDKDVFDRFEVKTQRSVVIRGAVEGARIDADEDVTVKGAILGRRKGHVTAGGYIVCTFATGARLEAGTHVSISKYCFDSTIRCAGTLMMPEAVFSGGEASCRGGAVVATLGSATHSKTTVRVGIDESLPGVLSDLNHKIEDAGRLLAEAEKEFNPYAGVLADLRGVERENAARILKRIKELEARIADRRGEVDRILAERRETARAAIEVRKRIHAGVELYFDGAKTRFKADLAGPVRIELRREPDGVDVVAVDPETNAETVLPTEPYDILRETETAETV